MNRAYLTVWCVLATALLLLSVSCGGSSESDEGEGHGDLTGYSVETAVSANTVSLGGNFAVTCTALNPQGVPVSLPTQFSVQPSEGVGVSGNVVTPQAVGTYQVTCRIQDSEVIDSTPEVVSVVEQIGEIDTQLDRNEIKAGETANATCTAVDSYGNPMVLTFELSVTPDPGAGAVTGLSVSPTAAGTYQVACQVVGGPQDQTPAQLTVVPADPAKVTTVLGQDEIAAGESTSVTCVVEDAYGNEITGQTTYVVADSEDVTVSGATVSSDVAGEYEIRCKIDSPPVGMEEQPDTLTVKAGSPFAVVITVNPYMTTFAADGWTHYLVDINKDITIDYEVQDMYGNEVQGATGSLTYTPPGGVTGTYRFTTEGVWTFTVTLDPPHNQLTDAVKVVVDATSPTVQIDFPERGDTILKSNANDQVTVTGKVTDAGSGLKSLKVNGVDVSPQSDGSFSYAMNAAHALNTVRVEAEDLAQNTALATRGYYYSTKFYDPDNASELIEDGLLVFLGQLAMDRGEPPTYDPCDWDLSGQYACSEIRDIATIMELVVNSIDLAEALPQTSVYTETWYPVSYSEPFFLNLGNLLGGGDIVLDMEFLFQTTIKLDVFIESIELGTAKVLQLKSRNGGLDASIRFSPHDSDWGITVVLGLKVDVDVEAFLMLVDCYEGSTSCKLTFCTILQLIDLLFGTPMFSYLCAPDPDPIAYAYPAVYTKAATLKIKDMTVGAKLDVSLDQSTNQPEVQVTGLTITFNQQNSIDLSALEEIEIDLSQVAIFDIPIDLGTYTIPIPLINDIAQALITPLLNSLDSIIGPVLQFLLVCDPATNPACIDVGSFIEDLLAAFAFDQELQVPLGDFLPGLPSPTISLYGRLSEIQFTDEGATVGLAARSDSEEHVYDRQGEHEQVDDDYLGVVARDGCGESQPIPTINDVELLDQKPAQVGVHLDLFNMIMAAIWWTGGFDITLPPGLIEIPPEFDVSELNVKVRMLLPPVVTSCVPKLLLVEIGDLFIDASLKFGDTPIQLKAFLSFAVDSHIVATGPNELGLQLESEPYLFEMEIIELVLSGQEPDEATQNALVAVFRDTLVGELLKAISSSAIGQIPFPEIDLSVIPGVAPGTMLYIGNIDATETLGYIFLRGDLL